MFDHCTLNVVGSNPTYIFLFQTLNSGQERLIQIVAANRRFEQGQNFTVDEEFECGYREKFKKFLQRFAIMPGIRVSAGTDYLSLSLSHTHTHTHSLSLVSSFTMWEPSPLF